MKSKEPLKLSIEPAILEEDMQNPAVLKIWQQGVITMVKAFFAMLCGLLIYLLFSVAALYIVPSISVYVYQLSGLQAAEFNAGMTSDLITSMSVWLLPSLFLDAGLFVALLWILKYAVRNMMGLRNKVICDFTGFVTRPKDVKKKRSLGFGKKVETSVE